MFKLDNNFLIELGLGDLPPVEKNKMLAHIYETLEMRVGMKLAEQMSNEQLDEFESYINKQDEAGALKWLETNFPNYKQVVAEELEKLKGEIKQVAPQIVAQAQQAAAAQPQPQVAPQQPPPAPAPQMQQGQAPPAPGPAPQQPPVSPPQPQQPAQPAPNPDPVSPPAQPVPPAPTDPAPQDAGQTTTQPPQPQQPYQPPPAAN